MIATTQTCCTRQEAAVELEGVLDSKLFKALCEPGRVDILKFLVLHGRSDIGEIAAAVPQDRSVVSRHLKMLQEVGVLCFEKSGRHRFYAIDGDHFLGRMRDLLDAIERIMPVCCPREPNDEAKEQTA